MAASKSSCRFRTDRAGFPALALTADTAVLTAWANDVGFDDVFARQVEAIGNPGDVLMGISTSGRSRNLLSAFRAARRLGLRTLAVLGHGGGDLKRLADHVLIVPSDDTQRIQEVQRVALHLLCELVDARLMEEAREEREADAAATAARRHRTRSVPDELAA